MPLHGQYASRTTTSTYRQNGVWNADDGPVTSHCPFSKCQAIQARSVRQIARDQYKVPNYSLSYMKSVLKKQS
jgi:hypothetical protein